MQPLTPALLPQYQQFLAFSQARQESQASASQGDVSNHDLPAMNHQSTEEKPKTWLGWSLTNTSLLVTTPAVHVAEMHDFKPLEPATHAGSHEAEPGGGDLAASNAEPNCSNYTKPNSHSPATVEDGELGKPSWRQLLRLRMGCARGRRWLRYRKFVGTACLQLGISLNQPFCSYPYESQMDTITSITKLVGPKYGWDEELTRDVIRVLCFDRVTLNHKRKKEKKDQYHRVRQKKRAKIDPPLFRVDLQSGIREITLYFSQNTSYTCFKAAVFGNHLQLAPGEKLHYKARYGTQKDTELKPIMFKKDFIAMLKMNPNVGVMLHVCPDVKNSFILDICYLYLTEYATGRAV